MPLPAAIIITYFYIPYVDQRPCHQYSQVGSNFLFLISARLELHFFDLILAHLSFS